MRGVQGLFCIFVSSLCRMYSEGEGGGGSNYFQISYVAD